jgi:hypothetical protein
MSSISWKVRAVVLGALVALVVVVGPVSSASAQTLNGIWAPATRCPVDDAQLLAADGVNDQPRCIASSSPSGSITLGNTNATTGASDLQLGATVDNETAEFSLISPAGGGLVAEPSEVPGGLLGLMCPSNVPLVSALCTLAVNSQLNRVEATVVPAGEPSDFDRPAGLAADQPIITLPVKVNLDNPLLSLVGPNCSIGSDSDPMILRPRNAVAPTLEILGGDLDGTPNQVDPRLITLNITGTDQYDDTFAAPGAHNCGGLGVVDAAINLQQGLPSPSGNNSLVLNDAEAHIIGQSGFGPVTGEEFSDGWHSAVLP